MARRFKSGRRNSRRNSRSTRYARGGQSRARGNRVSRPRGGSQTVRIVLEAPGQQPLPASPQTLAALKRQLGVAGPAKSAGRPSTAKF